MRLSGATSIAEFERVYRADFLRFLRVARATAGTLSEMRAEATSRSPRVTG
jgi:hypothetical protein